MIGIYADGGRTTPDKAITEIRWRPRGEGKEREMAVSSEDGSVRVYGFKLEVSTLDLPPPDLPPTHESQ
jgi:hypothetical protein